MNTIAFLLSLIMITIFLLMAILPLMTLPNSSSASENSSMEKKFSITIVENTAKTSPDRIIISLSSDTISQQIASHTVSQERRRYIDLLH